MHRAALFVIMALSLLAAGAASAQTRFPGETGSRTLNTAGHPKAKGLEVRVDFPQSWSIQEGKRPNTVALAVSQDGRGLQNCAVTITTVEQDGWDPAEAAAETSRSLSAPERLQEMAQAMDTRLLGGGPANIEGLPSRWAKFGPIVPRDGGSYRVANLVYQVLFRDKVLTLVCSTGGADDQGALDALEAHSDTFRRIANSIVIPARWR